MGDAAAVVIEAPRVLDVSQDKQKFERACELLKTDPRVIEANRKTIQEFIDVMTAHEIGYARLTKYIQYLTKASEWLGKEFEAATKRDIEVMMGRLRREGWEEWTRATFKSVLKKFYQWLRGMEGEEYPEEVKWLKTTIKLNNRIIPTDLLTEQEVLALINACNNDRDRALIALMYDIGPRPSELLRLRVKDVVIDYETEVPTAIITLRGKTGMRRVRAIFSTPYLIRWKRLLPPDPEFPFWPYNRGLGYLKRDGLQKILRTVKKRAGIKKRIYPYLFRHTRATIYASVMTEAQMCEFFGWVQGSRMPAVYVHLSGRDVDDRLLEFYNLKRDRKAKEENKPWQCVACGAMNPAHMDTCYNCMKLRPSQAPLKELVKELIAMELSGRKDEKKLLELLEKLE